MSHSTQHFKAVNRHHQYEKADGKSVIRGLFIRQCYVGDLFSSA
jgi:hypothetical protein